MNNYKNIYIAYIECLNKREIKNLGRFIHEDVYYNHQQIGLSGYQQMLEQNFIDIPDLYFNVELLICDEQFLASRLMFDCSPKGIFLGLPINGKRVSFSENVFYKLNGQKIENVLSVIDKAAIEKQL